MTYTDTFTEVLSKVAATNADVAPSKFEVIDQDGIFRLLHYEAITPKKYRTPLLIVCAFINRPYVLDLQPEISVIQKYLRAGLDVYSIDWGYPGPADRFLNLDDYGNFIDRSVRLLRKEHGLDAVNVHGYCLGGTVAASYTALYPDRVRNLALQATPIDFHTDNLIAQWARSIDPNQIVDAYHMAPGKFMNLGFLMVDPVNLVMGKYAGFLEMNSEAQVSNFLRMDKWVFDSPSIPGETFRQYITEWYHKNSLVKGEFKMMGRRVDLGNITAPVLVLAANFDHIVPPLAQKAILNVVSSRDKQAFEIDKGHIGITTSRESHKEFWQKAVKWFETRSEKVDP